MSELLAPARDLRTGMTAIDCGADAVYIGAPLFSARSAAGNSIQDIEQLCTYAHKFGCRVLVALNTILTDKELPVANRIIWDVYNAGADALIIQDFGLLETNLPPIRLHASTQCNNVSIEHIKWLEQIGFSRVVLARELSLDEIRAIRAATSIELEAFVHGALCVSYSGQCYMSAALRGRSANRGECAQMCRLPYDLTDANGKEIIHNKHLLSLYDMNRSAYLNELIAAGITTFKIEGRLKDENYVKNIVTYYCRLLGRKTDNNFNANPAKSFHRSQTDYFLSDRTQPMANFDTPKSTGEKIGTVVKTGKNNLVISTQEAINIGDGICVSSEGFSVSDIAYQDQNTILYWDNKHASVNPSLIRIGMSVYRNFDRAYTEQLTRFSPKRRLPIDIILRETDSGFSLKMQTDKFSSECSFSAPKETASNQTKAEQTIRTQLGKLGNTIFEAANIEIELSNSYFIPISTLNEWRRETAEKLEQQCLDGYVRAEQKPITHAPYYSDKPLDYHANIYNRMAADFYRSCGAEIESYAFESDTRTIDKIELMRCRYCLKYELGWCKKQQSSKQARPQEPYFLRQGNQLLQLHFDCKNCQMIITK